MDGFIRRLLGFSEISELRGRGTSAVRSRYQKTGEEKADGKHSKSVLQ
jgi:hypothetical protein